MKCTFYVSFNTQCLMLNICNSLLHYPHRQQIARRIDMPEARVQVSKPQ